MRVAIVHYHLRRGGVTRVIETALEGLAEADAGIEICVLSGEPALPASPLSGCHRVVPGLAYRERTEPGDGPTLAAELEKAAASALGGPPQAWHFHNHSLGKNLALPAALDRLLAGGARVLLQIHDFAEDGRPENYRRQRQAADPARLPWYPDAPQVHYAALNRRDAAFLARAGLAEERLHLLPNAVAPPPVATGAAPPEFARGRPFLLYPTRGIRRKNLGELLLLAALTGDELAYATTLAPENPEWLAIHERWRAVAARHRLPVELGIGADPSRSYGELAGAADCFLTTSVAEGFGLAFLEPWLAGKSVRGRDLPEITGDFAAAGVDLPGLYCRMDAPVAWIDSNTLHGKLEAGLRRAFRAYGRELPDDAVERAYMAAVTGGKVDFGRLDEELQEAVIEAVLADPAKRGALPPPALSPAPHSVVAANAAVVAASHGIPAYGRRLAGIYRDLAQASPARPGALGGEALLDGFLDPGRFCLLRS